MASAEPSPSSFSFLPPTHLTSHLQPEPPPNDLIQAPPPSEPDPPPLPNPLHPLNPSLPPAPLAAAPLSSTMKWSTLFNSRPANAGKFTSSLSPLVYSGDVLVPSAEIVEAGNSVWSEYLVGFFIDKPLSYTAVLYHLNKKWNLKGKITVKSNGYLFLIQLSNADDRKKIIEADPLVMNNKLFIVKRWDPALGNCSSGIKAVPIWIKLVNVPMFAWSLLGISWLASRIGKFLCMDESTEKLNRLEYAKCMVEIDPNNSLPDEFPVRMVDGSTHYVRVQYQWKPEICTQCSEFGHMLSCCDKVKNKEGKWKHQEAVNDVTNQTINNDSEVVMGPIMKTSEHAKVKRVPLKPGKQTWRRVINGRKKKTKSIAFVPSTDPASEDCNEDCMDLRPDVNCNQKYLKQLPQTMSSNPCNKSHDSITSENQFSVLNDMEEGEIVRLPLILSKSSPISISKGKEKEVNVISPDDCLFSSQVLSFDSFTQDYGHSASTSTAHESAVLKMLSTNSSSEKMLSNNAPKVLSPSVLEKNPTASPSSKQSAFKFGFLNPKQAGSQASPTAKVPYVTPVNLENAVPKTVVDIGHANPASATITVDNDATAASCVFSQRRNKSVSPSNFYAHIKAPPAYRPPPGYVNGVNMAENPVLDTDEDSKQLNDNRNPHVTRKMLKKMLQEEEKYDVL